MAKVEYPKFIYKAGEAPKIVLSKIEHDDHDGWQEEPVAVAEVAKGEVALVPEVSKAPKAAKPKKEKKQKAVAKSE